MNSWIGVGEGLGLGLATGLHCVGACAPLAISLTLPAEGGSAAGWRPLAAFLAARAGGYAAFVGLAAVTGLALADTPWLAMVSGGMGVVVGAVLALHALRLSVPSARPCAMAERWGVARGTPWIMGVLVGVSPCPPLLLLAASLMDASNGAAGLAAVGAFLAATTALMLAAAWAGRGLLRGRLAGFARAMTLVVALWFMAKGVGALSSSGVGA